MFAISVRDVRTGLDLAEARALAASLGARLPTDDEREHAPPPRRCTTLAPPPPAASPGAPRPTEDEWQLPAEAGVLDLSGPRVWNWTESEHSDGRTRFVILKGGSDWKAEGSEWYVEGGPQDPRYSLKLLLLGGGLARSPNIGFRLAVDLWRSASPGFGAAGAD